MTSKVPFSAQIFAALVVANLQICWLFPLLFAFSIKAEGMLVPILVVGTLLAWIIGMLHSLLVLFPVVTWLGQAKWEAPAGRLFALLLPGHLLSVAAPLAAITMASGSGWMDPEFLTLGLLFTLHSELVLFAFVRHLQQEVTKKDPLPTPAAGSAAQAG